MNIIAISASHDYASQPSQGQQRSGGLKVGGASSIVIVIYLSYMGMLRLNMQQKRALC